MLLDQTLTMQALGALGERGASWSLDGGAAARVADSSERLQQLMLDDQQPIYGLHTHFGHNSAHATSGDDWLEHQLALLNYLKVGVGPPLAERTVRRALRLQVYKVGLGYSGVHPETFARLQRYCDTEQLPTVPSYGSLGASGDLIPMAHAVSAMFAEAAPAGPRDVLALVNTNAMMASLAVDCFQRVQHLHHAASCGWLLHSEACGWVYSDLDQASRGWNARGPGSKERDSWTALARAWHAELKKQRTAKSAELPGIQARYSLRCAPQVLVDVQENLTFAAGKIHEEALGLADNPLIMAEQVWHGGLFYTAGLSSAAELMQNAVVRLSDLMDRQVLLSVTPEFNHGLSPNLRGEQPGDHVKGLHQLASALLQKIKGMSLPAYLMSFSCESNNQDIVPASMSALLLVSEALSLAEQIARIHLFTGERAWALRDSGCFPGHLSLAGWEAYRVEPVVARYLEA